MYFYHKMIFFCFLLTLLLVSFSVLLSTDNDSTGSLASLWISLPLLLLVQVDRTSFINGLRGVASR